MTDQTVFDVTELSFRYPGAPRTAVGDVSFRVPPGSFYATLGPNGSGKSTLLKLMTGALAPGAGSVRYRRRGVGRGGVRHRRGGRSSGGAGVWSRRELARRIGVVPQFEEPAFPMRVRDYVGMGRYPHLGGWQRERSRDRRAVAAAMRRCEVSDLAGRLFRTLSGGERQRARIARALAQEPETLVLDEPTASLDIHHEMAIFRLLAELAAEDGVTVFLVTHHINLAARFADALLLLDEGRVAARGRPDDVIRRDVLERVYGWPVAVEPHPGPGPDAGAPQVVPLACERPRSRRDQEPSARPALAKHVSSPRNAATDHESSPENSHPSIEPETQTGNVEET